MRKRIDKSTWAEIRTAYASGIGLRELARNMCIPAGTVLARAKREGWTRQIQDARALAPMQSNAITPMQSAALTIAERGQQHVERMARTVERVGPHVETMEPGAILDRIDDIEKLDKVARRTFGIEGAGAHNPLVSLTFNAVPLAELIPLTIETGGDHAAEA